MSKTLQKEMNEDEELYDKLACWCNNNDYEKTNAISDGESKSAELSASIESLTAKSAALDTSIKELDAEVASDKQALAEATALREKQQKEFHANELDSTQAIENLKAALEVLSKHAPPPDSTVEGGAIFKSERDSWESLLAIRSSSSRRDEPWTGEASSTHSLDDFMRRNGFDAEPVMAKQAPQKFLQHDNTALMAEAQRSSGWSSEDAAVVKQALKTASVFMQAHHGYYPAYHSRSGEIVGILKQLKDEMEGDLSESQKREQARAAAFEELRSAKTAEITNGDRMSEQKEDELATTRNSLAEAKEDHEQEQAALSENQQFLGNLRDTCADARKNFEARKAARLEEIKAVSDTIGILMQDEARDAMSGTYNFLQENAKANGKTQQRRLAAKLLRNTAAARKDPRLSILATSVELDAFTKVKQAIDNMIGMLKVQQSDEVKKNDFCKDELQENEMQTTRNEDHKADLEAKSAELSANIQTLEEGIAAGKAQVAQLQLDLQRASENRRQENLDFQKVVADQTVTVDVLKTALDRLATYYDKEALLQSAANSRARATRQAPPVAQMEYTPSKSSEGVMQLIEKLIVEAKALIADTVKSESEAQSAYEQTVADTNGSVAALQQEIASKSKSKAEASRDKMQTESDIAETVNELEGLAKYNGELHADCDYLMTNFGSRQEARSQEIEALQQAKQILNGASLS